MPGRAVPVGFLKPCRVGVGGGTARVWGRASTGGPVGGCEVPPRLTSYLGVASGVAPVRLARRAVRRRGQRPWGAAAGCWAGAVGATASVRRAGALRRVLRVGAGCGRLGFGTGPNWRLGVGRWLCLRGLVWRGWV
ncbi:hypothetical protein GCM10010245_29250 [Streptomyces spectabilis]|nr:hypothetical protein GCM10010245_29250 [Streptomyces spectabilis]